jgi:hypothetical protein
MRKLLRVFCVKEIFVMRKSKFKFTVYGFKAIGGYGMSVLVASFLFGCSVHDRRCRIMESVACYQRQREAILKPLMELVLPEIEKRFTRSGEVPLYWDYISESGTLHTVVLKPLTLDKIWCDKLELPKELLNGGYEATIKVKCRIAVKYLDIQVSPDEKKLLDPIGLSAPHDSFECLPPLVSVTDGIQFYPDKRDKPVFEMNTIIMETVETENGTITAPRHVALREGDYDWLRERLEDACEKLKNLDARIVELESVATRAFLSIDNAKWKLGWGHYGSIFMRMGDEASLLQPERPLIDIIEVE